MVEEVSVIKVISDCLGCVEYEDLLKKLEVDDVENVIKNSDVFTVVQQNRSKKILVTTKIRRCRIRECQETCTDLHLCKYGLLGQCNTPRCKYGHSLKTEHNSRVLREHGLQDLNKDQLRVLLLQNDSSLLPNVCVSYNKGSGNFGNCPDKEACVRLHVCERYIRGLCDGSECNRCHDFHEPHPVKTLQARGVASQLIGSLLQIYQNILTLKDHRNAQDKHGGRSTEYPKFQQPSNRAKEPLERNRVIEICRSFIRGTCKHGDKCCRVHFGLPYKWELEVDGVWIDLPDREVIEKDYCDPAKIHSVGGEPVWFETMKQGEHRVRRLSTVSSVIDPSFSHTTRWMWYWEDEYNKWIQYGSIKEMHRLSSITCEELEKNYLHYLEDNSHDVVKFTAGKQCYELNFKTMKQRNETSSTERAVRRRPLFVSLFDVRIARTSGRGPNSSCYTGVPGFWDKSAVPESGFQRVFLDSSQKDYVRVQEHFYKTMKDFTILTIERVQNKELWEDFQTKRARMKKANSHKKYGEGERLLFHGTSTKNIEAICRQNFDMRVSGVNATVYGQGSYFARDAKYSNDYADDCGERSMFVCRVLVGQYTKGLSYYRRPPAKDTAGNLYDSCVNDVHNPSIYVVFDRSQVYPEFLITYEKSRFPNVIQSSIFDDVFDVSRRAGSVTSTGSSHSITSASASTGETLAATSMPNALHSPSPVKYVLSDFVSNVTMIADKLDVDSAAPKSELSVHSKPTQSLTSLSRLQKESSIFDDVFDVRQRAERVTSTSSSYSITSVSASPGETLATASIPNALDSPLSPVVLSDSDSDFEMVIKDAIVAAHAAPISKSPVSPFACFSDEAKIFQASSTTYFSEMESKTPIKTSSAHKQSLDVFDDIFNVSQATSVISTRSPQKEYITSSASAGEESCISKPAKGLVSSTGLSGKPSQDLLTLEEIPLSSQSNDQLLISVKPSVTDSSIRYKMRPDLVTKQRSPQQDSPAAQTGVPANFSHPLLSTTPSSGARNLSTNASSPGSHSARESKISAMYTPSSSSSNKQYRSDGSLSSSSASFYERQPSALSSIQTPSKSVSPLQASQQKKDLGAQSEQKQKCRLQ
ncbi:hypothetical protein KOW79_016052 [Hemibagrus wyckioides]|uniref:Poly [ADP-ribose] polymerase 12-like n=1 Tax=Hemibagrus wyckioides TaxID=337641 RepID=A0A9D3ND21_9TELE|nr:protein mono-ADP-ribosyltransferase PARP12-like [Hemibagrus wyckioides]KAG7320199.1 hypothetical protein KOW79_016052 [Hemibagrus wyckioides]